MHVFNRKHCRFFECMIDNYYLITRISNIRFSDKKKLKQETLAIYTQLIKFIFTTTNCNPT